MQTRREIGRIDARSGFKRETLGGPPLQGGHARLQRRRRARDFDRRDLVRIGRHGFQRGNVIAQHRRFRRAVRQQLQTGIDVRQRFLRRCHVRLQRCIIGRELRRDAAGRIDHAQLIARFGEAALRRRLHLAHLRELIGRGCVHEPS